MDPSRPTFWNVTHASEITQYVLGTLTVLVFLAGVYWRVRKWRMGRPEACAEPIGRRLKNVLRYGLFQMRLSEVDPFALVMHLAIFWGMFVLAIGTAVATVDWDVTHLLFGFQFLKGSTYFIFELALDIFGVILIVGLGMAIYRRYFTRAPALAMVSCPSDRWSSLFLLATLMLIAVTGFVAEGLRLEEGFRAAARLEAGETLTEAEQLAARNVAAAYWAPVGFGVAKLFSPLSSSAVLLWHQVVWWVHALAVFVFIASIPFTKAFHIISAPLNIYFSEPSRRDRLVPVQSAGARTLRDFTWRELLQVDACTWCGKCLDACPTGVSGRAHPTCGIVQKLSNELSQTKPAGRWLWTPPAPEQAGGNGASESNAAGLHNLHETAIEAGDLWSCCMCGDCQVRCPVFIEHPRLIVDMRRHLVDRGEVREGLQDALMSLTRYGNSFSKSPRKRAAWTKQLDFPLQDAKKEEVDYLWFTGDYASYDPRGQVATLATARVLHHAGLDMGILQDKEQNSGNDVRRVGEEGLFELLREKNLQALEKAKYRSILTTDPHTYNALKNEYRVNGGVGAPVVHHTEVLDELIRAGKLKIERQLGYVATYHDPCFLGRYNGVYDEPRRVLAALGVRLVEMPRHRSESFCCGAGGGRIWMKDDPDTIDRPAEHRIEEALELDGVSHLVVACPKDLAMFEDAVKTAGAEDRLQVVDLGQLVWEAVTSGITAEVPS